MPGFASPVDGPEDYERWIAEARQGSREAIDKLLDAGRQSLLFLANHCLDPDLRARVGESDLVQETQLKAYEAFDQFAGRTREEWRGWLRAILLNHAKHLSLHHHADKRNIRCEIALDDPALGPPGKNIPDRGRTPSSLVRQLERDAALEGALDELPPAYRQVIQWRSLDRCQFETIGLRLGRSRAAARKLWARAIKQLAERLGPSHDSP